MGPFLVYKEAVPFPVHLTSSLKSTGSAQHSNTKHLIFDIPTLIHILSQGLTLKPGDILATGTPSGVDGVDPPDI